MSIYTLEELQELTPDFDLDARLETFLSLSEAEQRVILSSSRSYREKEPQARVEVETYLGGDRLLAHPKIECKWGVGQKILWSGGEALWIVGEGGLGKSTIAQQLALARAGVTTPEFLDYPVEVDAGRVLYIAADRPRQIYSSMRRMITDEQIADMNASLVWAEDVPAPLSADPHALTEFVDSIPEVGTVFIDSLKDVASDLGSDGEGNNVNLALKNLIHSGREVVVLHHNRKLDIQGKERTPRQADVYGSRWLAAGAGSIFFLTGDPGTAHIKAIHVKSPSSSLGTLELRHDFRWGKTYISEGPFG